MLNFYYYRDYYRVSAEDGSRTHALERTPERVLGTLKLVRPELPRHHCEVVTDRIAGPRFV